MSSSALGVPEREVAKTLVMETDKGEPLVVLMHGDRKVSTRELARIYINGGRRGYLLGMAPGEIVRALAPVLVEVGREE